MKKMLKVVEAWGFEYMTIITWMKDRQGLGQYYRGLTEHCIFARTKRKLPYKLEDGKRQQGVSGFCAAKGQAQCEAGRDAEDDRKSELRPANRTVRA